MSFATNHSTPPENEPVALEGAPTGTSSNESPGAGAQPTPLEHQPTVLLSQTKNYLETVYREARQETILNGKYIVDDEDETYYYCYYQTTYRTKVLKDLAKKGMTYRDSKGRLLPGFSLVSATKSEDNLVKSKTRKRYTKKTAEKYLENDLIADLIEDIQTSELSDKDRVNAKLALVNYVKPTLSKMQTEKVIKIVGDDFEDANVVEGDKK